MITTSATVQSILKRSFQMHFRAESWLGSTLLADNIPVSSGFEEGNSSAKVAERITLVVPKRDRGVDWAPIFDTSPLSANGQRLRIEIGISLGRGQITWIQRGWFVITESELNGDQVNVEAASLLWLIQEADLVNPYSPSGTYLTSVRGLLEPTLTAIDIGVANRNVASGVAFTEKRLDAVYELLDAWGVRGQVNEEGVFEIIPADVSKTSLRSYTNGAGGTLIKMNGSSSRSGGFTIIVASGSDSNGNTVQGVAYNDKGPRSYGGPFNPQPVPFRFFSPLITTNDEARKSAQTILARKRRESGSEFSAEIVPDPTIQLGDVVDVTNEYYTNLLCTVEAYSLPYVASGGSMSLTLRSVL